jgi:hypothetical protein
MTVCTAPMRAHRDRQLGDERQVQGDAVAPPHPQRFQDVRERADLTIQVPVRQGTPVTGLPFPDERRLVPARRAHVPVEAIGARIELAADEPLRVWRVPAQDLGPGLDPFELPGELRPERFRVPVGAVVDRGIGDERALLKFGRGRKASMFLEKRVYLRHDCSDCR